MVVTLSILPIFFIIVVGLFFKKIDFPNSVFWNGAEKMTYYIFFPALLIYKMSSAEIGEINLPSLALSLMSILLLMTVFMIVAHKIYQRCTKRKVQQKSREKVALEITIGDSVESKVSPTAFTSVFQGGIRFNTYIGLAIVSTLYGSEGLVVAVVIAAIMIPLINVLCVTVLEVYHSADNVVDSRYRRLGTAIVTNPLIVACVLGITINVLAIPIPFVVNQVLYLFSQVALPLGLLTVGAALNLRGFGSAVMPVTMACLSKFVLLPVVAMGCAYAFGLSELEQGVLLVLSLLPTATASYVLAKQLGGDAQLMATIITLQTLLSALWIPLALSVFGVSDLV
ncbi:MAG: putative permease [Granulosicoccus sp.]|jgi:predicted permease